VEVENEDQKTPASEWDTDDWEDYKAQIKSKQDLLVNSGCVTFVCELMSRVEDPEINDECLLICISLLLGGNFAS
jgi:hypothetical protein